ncbi:ATP-binding protein [Amycolatopsis jiangsuensis]|uniref:Anti-sigma regulatory factor (Ser/Thr protein kinase) n=1 Tax=Amycolatopsis jiangsuensis TaxID=1181879 RepID=A0A840IWC1_9PSEU|nr:ATP-binding protein [Amycolatopsis jiangsuensis]MBB4686886.1 anti-sigma regulatory factor (Ser/Thr protein kinase) [Amycolatopsis jiangsuensis]
MTTSKLPAMRTTAPDPVRLHLPDDVTAPAVARHKVRTALASIDLPGHLRDDVLLATSELVTNAVEHGERPERLELMLTTDELVVSVFDRGSKIPELKEPMPAAARSRGLQLVHALSARWGYDPAEGGKCVWAAFAL